MNMSKHTPGNWEAVHRSGSNVQIESRDYPAGRLATVYGNATNDHERDANARLIAAAPDLLAALEMLLFLNIEIRVLDAAVGHEALSRARAAIAKARGE